MSRFRVLPLSSEVAAAVRRGRRSPGYGHPAHSEVAGGTGPCRSCLRLFRPGKERRILFTYDAFAGVEQDPSPGPVFIHEEACGRYEEDGFPPELRALPLVLESYAPGRWLVERRRVSGGGVDQVLTELLRHPAVRYVHLRHGEAGCYLARVVPA